MSLTGRTPIVDSSRILVAGVVALVAALVVNLALRAIALALVDISAEFMPLATNFPVILFTTLGVLGATAVYFFLVRRRRGAAVATFRRLAIIVLILSFLPDIGLLLSGAPGATLPAILALMVMHVTTAVIVVGVLTRMTVRG